MRAHAKQLLRFLASRRPRIKHLLILTHNHPDPDGIASAWALAHLCRHRYGIRSRMVYGGAIGRRENKMLVETLNIPIRPARPGALDRAVAVAMVDTQPPFQNNLFSGKKRSAFLVMDHHPRHKLTKTECALIDKRVGATATLLAEALEAARLKVPSRLATALVYGISSETQALGREAGPRDVAAYRRLFEYADLSTLARIQNPSRKSSFFVIMARAIREAFTCGRVIGVHLGTIPHQDVVSQMADFLLTHEGMRWCIVTGRYKGRLHVSLRTSNQRAEAGQLLRRLLGSGTAGGGHGMVAGGAIAMGKVSAAGWRRAERDLAIAFMKRVGASEELKHPFRLKENKR